MTNISEFFPKKKTTTSTTSDTTGGGEWTQTNANTADTSKKIVFVKQDRNVKYNNRRRDNRPAQTPKNKVTNTNTNIVTNEQTKNSDGWKPTQLDTTTPEGQLLYNVKIAQGYLNKMTENSFAKLSEKFVEVAKRDLPGLLKQLIDKVFEQSLRQPAFCDIYALLCQRIHTEMKTFRKVLLEKCQEEFEKEDTAVPASNDLSIDISSDELSILKYKSKKRMLGNIKFIGELYRNNVLVEPVMHECIVRLLRNQGPTNPDEEQTEALCDLLKNIGKMLDTDKNREKIDSYFQQMEAIQNSDKTSSRIRFKIEDLADLRKNEWFE